MIIGNSTGSELVIAVGLWGHEPENFRQELLPYLTFNNTKGVVRSASFQIRSEAHCTYMMSSLVDYHSLNKTGRVNITVTFFPLFCPGNQSSGNSEMSLSASLSISEDIER